jgi:metallo-beta-lactamase class B
VYYSFSGEWKIDESMNDLYAAGDYGAIIIGIDNGSSERFDEYNPWTHPTFGGGDGEAYIDFLVHTLKPHIDSTFRTLPGRDYTAIAGSSMGGLISSYALAEYPEVFSKAGIFSPAYWVADSAYIHVASKTFTSPSRIYFVASETESTSMIPDMQEMRDLFHAQGIGSADLYLLNEPDGAHSEWFWAREFPDVYQWLFEGLVLTTETPAQKKIDFFPNPVKHTLHFPNNTFNNFILYASTGMILATGKFQGQELQVDHLPAGLYGLRMWNEAGVSHAEQFIKL